MLELGARIVRELELDQSVDTLGRWLSHHLAEMIVAAKEKEGLERERAEAKAIELILRLWERRSDLPGNVHPLKELEPVFEIFHLLAGASWPYAQASKDSTKRLLKKAFIGLRHIVSHGAFLEAGKVGHTVKIEGAEGFLATEEAALIHAANAWTDLYDKAPENPVVIFVGDDRKQRDARKAELAELLKLNPDERARIVFTKQVEQLQVVLEQLKKRLAQNSAAPE